MKLHHHIFPHLHEDGEQHHAHGLGLRSLFIYLQLVLIFTAGLYLIRVKAPDILGTASFGADKIIALTNQKRAEKGLAPVVYNAQLAAAAAAKANHMFSENYWAHNSPSGKTPWSFIGGAGYRYIYAGENLARGFNSAQDVVSAWMASPDHRSNLLSPNFKDVGFAVINGKLGGEETFLVVQELGSKSVLPASVNIISSPKQEKMTGFSLSPALNGLTLSMSSEFIILFIVLIISVLIIDMVVVRRKKIVRFTGHSMDHLTFLLLILFVVIIFDMGIIL